jgi:hypothetical protein
MSQINSEFTEPFGGGPGIRFQIRGVKIAGNGNTYRSARGGTFPVEMEILHNCTECEDALNQIIVGLAGENQAQVCVWHGTNFSGGRLMQTMDGTLLENNESPQWVPVHFEIKVPDTKGSYFIRVRYAQALTGNLATPEGRQRALPPFEEPLKWWKVDRPEGPGEDANIGLIVIE